MALLAKGPFESNLAVCGIDDGLSVDAVRCGVSLDTIIGFPSLEGVRRTKTGDKVIVRVLRPHGLVAHDVEEACFEGAGRVARWVRQ